MTYIMALSLLLPFVTAFVSVLLIGALARIAIGFFSVDRPAGFGAFCVALGFALARPDYQGPPSFEALQAVIGILGSVAALVLLWHWLVKPDPGLAPNPE